MTEILPLVLVSNSEPAAREWLAVHHLDRFFRGLVISSEVGVSKPDAKIFELALDVLGCSPNEAVMIGDRLDTDIRGAKSLGLQTIRVRRGPAFWQVPREDSERPDVTFSSLKTAAAYLN